MKDLGTVRLLTDRLILRRFEEDDASLMYNSWCTDPNSNKFLEWELHENVEVTRQVVKKWINEYDDGSYNWIVELKDTHEVIGSIMAVHIHKNDLNVEIGYCYASKFCGNGYATEALRRVIEFFINDCEMYLVEARHISGNPASGRVMEKAGMHKDAVLSKRRMNKVTKELDDLVYYSITKDEI